MPGTIVRRLTQRHMNILVPCLLALCLRLPGVFNGLPYVRHPDEPVNFRLFHKMVANRTALPRFYDYPSLQYDLQASVHAVVAGLGQLFGAWDSVDSLGMAPGRPGSNLALNSASWVVARLVTVSVAVIGVAVVVRLATRLSGSRTWGAVAGALAATSGVGILTGFLITPDALAGTLAISFLAVVMRLHGPGATPADRRWVVHGAVLLGLAVGAKYNNGALLVALAAGVALAPAATRPTARQLAALAGLAGGVFLLTTPGIVFDFAGFIHGLDRVTDHYGKGHAGYEGNVPAANIGYLWSSDALAAALAITAAATLRRRHVAVLAGWVVVYFGFTSIAKVHFDRNLTPLLGSLAVLGALGGQRVWQWLRTPRGSRSRAMALALTLVVLAPLAVRHVTLRAQEVSYRLTDYQADARAWLTLQLSPGSRVLTDYYTPWLDERRYELTDRFFVAQESASAVAEFATEYDAVILTSLGSGRFVEDRSLYPQESAVIDSIRNSACRTVSFEDAGGYWIEVNFQHCS